MPLARILPIWTKFRHEHSFSRETQLILPLFYPKFSSTFFRIIFISTSLPDKTTKLTCNKTVFESWNRPLRCDYSVYFFIHPSYFLTECLSWPSWGLKALLSIFTGRKGYFHHFPLTVGIRFSLSLHTGSILKTVSLMDIPGKGHSLPSWVPWAPGILFLILLSTFYKW